MERNNHTECPLAMTGAKSDPSDTMVQLTSAHNHQRVESRALISNFVQVCINACQRRSRWVSLWNVNYKLICLTVTCVYSHPLHISV